MLCIRASAAVIVVVAFGLDGCPAAEPRVVPTPPIERLRCAVAGFVERCPSSAFAIDRQEPALRSDQAHLFIENFNDLFTDPELVVDSDAFEACLASLADCDNPFGRSECQPDRIFHGPHSEGDACTFLSCEDGLDCVNDVCVPLNAEGDICAQRCSGPDLFCDAGRCAPTPKAFDIGDACVDVCQPGLACINGICEAQINADVGEPCDDSTSTVNALRYCIDQQAGRTYCRRASADEEGRCALTPLPGEPCASTFLSNGVLGTGLCRGARACDFDANLCLDGTSDTGEACTFLFNCPLSDRCEVATSTCAPLVQSGGACGATSDCAEGTSCVDGVCTARSPLCQEESP